MTPVDYDLDSVIEQLKDIGTRYCKSIRCDHDCDNCDHASLMRAIIQTVERG